MVNKKKKRELRERESEVHHGPVWRRWSICDTNCTFWYLNASCLLLQTHFHLPYFSPWTAVKRHCTTDHLNSLRKAAWLAPLLNAFIKNGHVSGASYGQFLLLAKVKQADESIVLIPWRWLRDKKEMMSEKSLLNVEFLPSVHQPFSPLLHTHMLYVCVCMDIHIGKEPTASCIISSSYLALNYSHLWNFAISHFNKASKDSGRPAA